MASTKLITKQGDVTKAPERYLCHQCNCTTDRVLGVAKAIFDAYPAAGEFLKHMRTARPDVGTIKVIETKEKVVINMFAQNKPGAPTYAETAKAREYWFRCCLDQIADIIEEGAEIAMPYGIGCVLAGGDIERYTQMLEEWSDATEKVSKVVLYRLN